MIIAVSKPQKFDANKIRHRMETTIANKADLSHHIHTYLNEFIEIFSVPIPRNGIEIFHCSTLECLEERQRRSEIESESNRKARKYLCFR